MASDDPVLLEMFTERLDKELGQWCEADSRDAH